MAAPASGALVGTTFSNWLPRRSSTWHFLVIVSVTVRRLFRISAVGGHAPKMFREISRHRIGLTTSTMLSRIALRSSVGSEVSRAAGKSSFQRGDYEELMELLEVNRI